MTPPNPGSSSHFAPPFIHFKPASRRYSVRVFLNDGAAGPQVFGPEWGGRPAERWPKTRESVVNNKVVRLADIAGDVENKEGSPLGCVHLSFKCVEPPGAPTLAIARASRSESPLERVPVERAASVARVS